MHPLKHSPTTRASIEALAKTRSAPAEIKKLHADYESPLSESLELAQSLVGCIYKKSLYAFLTSGLSIPQSLSQARKDQELYDVAMDSKCSHTDRLNNLLLIECPESRSYTVMAIVNELGDEKDFDTFLQAVKEHPNAPAMQALLKTIAQDRSINIYRALKTLGVMSNLQEKEAILYEIYNTSKAQVNFPASAFLAIAQITPNPALRDQILSDAIAQPSRYQHDFEAQLTAYSLLQDPSQAPRTRLQILEDFFHPDFVHTLSTLPDGYKTQYAWLTDDLFQSLVGKEGELVVKGLGHSIPGPNTMDMYIQIAKAQDLSKKILATFGEDQLLTLFITALTCSKMHFMALRQVLVAYFGDKSFDELLVCFRCLTEQAEGPLRCDTYGLLWVSFCLAHSRDNFQSLFEGTTCHTMGQGSYQWNVNTDKLPDAADIKHLITQENLACLAYDTAIDPEARKHLITILHKADKKEVQDAKTHFLSIINENTDVVRLNRIKAVVS